MPGTLLDKISNKYGHIDLNPKESAEFNGYEHEYKEYLKKEAYWVHLNKKNELKHFYKVQQCEVGQDTRTKEWQLWFKLQMDKDDTEWTEDHPAENLAVDRRTYMMCLRYLGQKYSGDYKIKATKLLVGNRGKKAKKEVVEIANKTLKRQDKQRVSVTSSTLSKE